MNIPELNSADLNEIRRLLQSIVRIGQVTAIDPTTTPPCVRVESGSLHTDWIPWATACAAKVAHWQPPAIGEDVLLLAIGGDTGNARVIGSLYSTAHPPVSSSLDKTVTRYPDGAWLEYDHATSVLTATLPGDAVIQAGGNVTVHAAGDIALASQRTLTLQAPQITLEGQVTATQGINAADDVTASGISLINHQHPGVERGGARSDPPG